MKASSKKGQLLTIENTASLLIIPFALAFIFIVLNLVFDQINTDWQSNIDDNTSKAIMGENESKFSSILDNGFIIIFLGLVIAGIAGLFVIDTHPILFIVVAIAFFALFLATAMLANSFDDATETGLINQYKNEFVFLPLFMENLLIIVIVTAGLFSLAFFAKLRLVK